MSRSFRHYALPILTLLAFAITAIPAFAESYTVSWNPVTGYADGAPFEAGKTIAYTVYWSTDPALPTASLKALAAGISTTTSTFDPVAATMTRGTTVYFTAKATLNSGEESTLATGVAWTVPRKAPGSPGRTRIIKL
jgi:hypothetical protein